MSEEKVKAILTNQRIDIYVHIDELKVSIQGLAQDPRIDQLLSLLGEMKAQEVIMSKELDDLQLAVEENTSLDGSIIELVNGLAAQILALKDEPAKLVALAASLKTASAAIAAAIQANTPPPPPPA